MYQMVFLLASLELFLLIVMLVCVKPLIEMKEMRISVNYNGSQHAADSYS